MSMTIGLSVLDTSLYISDLRPKRKETALREMVARAALAGVVSEPLVLEEALLLRERLGSTSVGKGVAVPNARSLAVIDPRLMVARSRRGIDWGSSDGLDIHLVFLVLSPGECPDESHHEFVARAVAVARLQRNRQKLLEASSFDAVASVLREASP